MKRILLAAGIFSLYPAGYGHEPGRPGLSFSPIGKWRAVFKLKPGVEVPFNFDIDGKTIKDAKAYFINAEERFEAGPVKIAGDSLFIPIDQFDNELAFKIEKDKLTGILRRQDKSGTPLFVEAEKGVSYRFKETGAATAKDISGTYDIIFKDPGGKDENAVGLFTQTGNKLRATFLRVTGDSRYLEGIVDGDDFYLSSFIGSGPSYYKGHIEADGSFIAEAIGARGNQPLTGIPNENAALPDPYSLTFLKNGYNSLDFSFPDISGKSISLKDDRFKNKAVIITITGTWCPNCIDEASFLAPWYIENRQRGVEIISLHYERKDDPAFVQKVLTRFKNRFNIQYTQLFAGIADKQKVAESLPALNTFLAFPTTIFIDKKGNVTKIHTGYSGPATGKYYEEFRKEFNDDVNALLKE